MGPGMKDRRGRLAPRRRHRHVLPGEPRLDNPAPVGRCYAGPAGVVGPFRFPRRPPLCPTELRALDALTVSHRPAPLRPPRRAGSSAPKDADNRHADPEPSARGRAAVALLARPDPIRWMGDVRAPDLVRARARAADGVRPALRWLTRDAGTQLRDHVRRMDRAGCGKATLSTG
jgi:hypothetical protein